MSLRRAGARPYDVRTVAASANAPSIASDRYAWPSAGGGSNGVDCQPKDAVK